MGYKQLNERNMNTELLRFLSKLQTDDQPGIRTNTAICIGKISKYLNNNVSIVFQFIDRCISSLLCSQSQKRILSGAFIQSCCDPFPPARNAGLLAFAGIFYIW